MATKTWMTTINGTTVKIKALKKDAEEFTRLLRGATVSLPYYSKELYGTIGESERVSIYYTMFKANSIVDPETHQRRVDEFMSALPEVLTTDDLYKLAPIIKSIRDDHMHVDDKRVTREEKAQRDQEYVDIMEQRRQERDAWTQAFVAQWTCGKIVNIPDGMRPIVIQLTYDDSNSMVDYFHSHARYGPRMILGFVPVKSRKDERKIRDIMNKYPELRDQEWTWHTENWSGGNGNYLAGEQIQYIANDVHIYGTTVNPACFFEISYGWDEEGLYGFRGYPGGTAPQHTKQDSEDSDLGFTVTHEGEWTWVSFPTKPSDHVLLGLRSAGARWSKTRKQWYFTNTVTKEFVEETVQ